MSGIAQYYLQEYSRLHLVLMFNVSAAVALLYDTILNFGDEVEHIWRSRISVPKVLYLFVRYYGLGQIIANTAIYIVPNKSLSLEFCHGHYWHLTLGGSIVFTTAVNIILLLRLHSLYQRSRKVLAFLVFVIVAEFAAELVICIRVALLINSPGNIRKLPVPWNGCLSTPADTTLLLVAYVPCFVATVIFFFMMLRRMMQNFVAGPEGKRVFDFKSLPPLLLAFVLDGTVYFFAITAILLTYMLFTILAPHSLKNLPAQWQVAVYAKAGSALILNLRKAASRAETYDISDFPLQSLSIRSRTRGLTFAPETTGTISTPC